MARTSSPSMQRFNWETAVARDPDLQRIDAFVQRTIAKLPGAAPPSSGAGRGSRYAPPLKSERPDSSTASTASTGTPAMVSTRRTSSSSSNSNSHADTSGSPQFINPRDYMSESSSEVDMREVNPMDELSDFESDASQQQQQQEQQEELEQQQQQDQDQDQDQEPMDVEMDADAEQEEADVDKNQTVCEVCRSSERERDIVLCDDCDAEYHVFCLSPPLPEVPEGTWYCPKCRVKYPDFEAAAAGVRVKAEKLRTARAGGAATESAGTAQANEATNAGEVAGTTTAPAPSGESEAANGGADGPASIPIIQALEENPESSNSLLIHACNCDDVKCADPEFHVFCPHMKRFLRSVCWASHSDKWRSYRLARITAELFAYHAMNCKLEQCNVPLCVKIREEEIV